MATLTLGSSLPEERAARLPRRVLLSRAAVEHLAATTGTPLPWRGTDHPSTARTLDAPDEPTPAGSGGSGDPVAELHRQHLLTALGDPEPELATALAVLGAPDVLVDVDVSVRRPAAPAGFAWLHSWQRLRDGRVAALSTAGGDRLELGWCDDGLWQVELARAVTVRVATGRVLPHAVVDLPHELLLGAGEAMRLGREDVLAELVGRHDGAVRVDDRPDPVGSAPALELVRLLHTASLGRMRTVVAGVGSTGARKAGWVSWLLLPDGWRALTPHVEGGQARVRVHPVGPLRLGVEVARLVAGVRA